MILNSDFGASSRRSGRRLLAMSLAASAALVATTPAFAQKSSEPGPYGVVRAGAQIDSDLKFPKPPKAPATKPGTTPARPVPPTVPPGFSRNVDGKAGFTGELGAGYDFGGFRLESTVGYGSSKINAKELGNASNVAAGRTKSLTLDVAGYVDLNPGGQVNPFVGGGIGASRVDAEISRLANPTTPATPAARRPGTRIDNRDWGFHWHLDAGLGYEVSPGTTLELAGRYTQTSALEFKGSTVAVTGTGTTAITTTTTGTFKPKMSSTSLMLGLRQKF